MGRGKPGASPLVVALDTPDLARARALATAVRASVGMIKIGLELFCAEGPAATSIAKDLDLPLFLDLKLYDIPETVDRAVAQVARTPARFLTIHAGGAATMVRRAVDRAKDSPSGLQIVAVTVVTSMDHQDLLSLGVEATPQNHARRLAALAYEQGVRAFVCSPGELGALRRDLGDDVILITPGIRPAEDGAKDDQKRVATVTRAIQDTADWLVVGRPIRDAPDPARAAAQMAEEALRARSLPRLAHAAIEPLPPTTRGE